MCLILKWKHVGARSLARSFVKLTYYLFVAEVSTTQPESSSEEEDERPSSLGVVSDSTDSEDEQGTMTQVLL